MNTRLVVPAAMRLPIIQSRSAVHLAALGRGAGRTAKVLVRCVKLILPFFIVVYDCQCQLNVSTINDYIFF